MATAEEKAPETKDAETLISLQIRMQTVRDREKYQDIFFKIGDPAFEGDPSKFERIGSIRAVVAGSSAVFDAMLYGNLMEARPGVDVEITDVEPQIFHIVLDFIFTDSVKKLSGTNVTTVLRVADKYDIAELKKACLRYIKQNRLIVDVLVDGNFRKYHGTQYPPGTLCEKFVYFPDFNVREFRRALSEQFSTAEDKIELWKFRCQEFSEFYIDLQDAHYTDVKLEDLGARWEADFRNGLYMRVLTDGGTALVRNAECDNFLVVLKYFDDIRMSLEFVGTCVLQNTQTNVACVSLSDMFEAFVSLTEGNFPLLDSCFDVACDEFLQVPKAGTSPKVELGGHDGRIFIFTDGSDKEGFKKFYTQLKTNNAVER